jgi:PAS domain S-box-containing protein
MSTQQSEISEIVAGAKPIVLINSNGEFAGANELGVEVHGYDRNDLMSMDITDTLRNPSVGHGKEFQQKLNGDLHETEDEIVRPDGTVVRIQVTSEPVEINGETHLKATTEILEEWEPTATDPDYATPDPTAFEDIDGEELKEVVQNIRVDAPEGKMPLNAIMLDLAVGHNELEQYKQGALSMHKAVDERLQEAEKQNPDSTQCEVLREVKKSAFGLYLRLQRGDEELHGKRDGRYSGYFLSQEAEA